MQRPALPDVPPDGYWAHPSAEVEQPCEIGAGTRIWRFCHVMAGARIGRACSLGQGVFVASSVVLGDRVRVQNQVSLYDGVSIEDDVFIGPACVLTNVRRPRAFVSQRGCYEPTRLARGCTLGANATIVCGVTIGEYAFVAAGAVVTKDVPAHALMLGVPARQHGWVSRLGHSLPPFDAAGIALCPHSAEPHQLRDGRVSVLSRAAAVH